MSKHITIAAYEAYTKKYRVAKVVQGHNPWESWWIVHIEGVYSQAFPNYQRQTHEYQDRLRDVLDYLCERLDVWSWEVDLSEEEIWIKDRPTIEAFKEEMAQKEFRQEWSAPGLSLYYRQQQ